MELDKNEVCSKCGYVRQNDDEGPDYACPKCGVTYDKIVALFGDPRPPVRSDEKKTVQSDGKKTKSCPYCGEEILAVAIKCKHCESDLESEPRESQQQAKIKTGVDQADQAGRNTVIGLASFFLILLLVLGKMNPVRGWAVLIGPFDSRPSISLSDAVNPEKLKKKSKKLCGWSKREYRRNPSLYTQVRRDAICEKVKEL